MWGALRLVLVVGLIVACTSGPTPSPSPSPPPPAHFRGYDFEIEHDPSWFAVDPGYPSDVMTYMAYLSTEPIVDPCCGNPAVRTLSNNNGIYITWEHWDFFGWVFDPAVGRLMEVGGRRATLESRVPSHACLSIGGDAELLATIPDAAPHNWTEVHGCLRGPDLGELQSKFEEMLASTRWVAPRQPD